MKTLLLVMAAVWVQPITTSKTPGGDKVFEKTVKIDRHQTLHEVVKLDPHFHYRVTVEALYGQPDLKLRVKRYWKNKKKFDSGWKQGHERVSCHLPSQDFGKRPWDIFVTHKEHDSIRVRIYVEKM